MEQFQKSRNGEAMERLVKQAKSDAQFFHNLIWNTEKALDSLDYLTRQEKASILAINPEDLVVGLATGKLIDPGIVATCGISCGASCGGSCGGTCGGSCGGSCTVTCSVSGGMPSEFGEVINPAETLSSDILSRQIQKQIENNFSRFNRG